MSDRGIMVDILGRLLGLEGTQTIDDYQATFGAAWAHEGPLWLLLGCLVLAALAVVFYLRYQPLRQRRPRVALAIARGAVLCALLLLLAEPILTVNVTSRKRPVLWLLFDGSESMAIRDDLPTADREALAESLEMSRDETQPAPSDPKAAGGEASLPSRIDYAKALVSKANDGILEKLGKRFRLQAFVFEGPQGVRALELAEAGRTKLDGKHLAAQLKAEGKVTAIGAALDDLGRRFATTNLDGVILLSDFNQNSGPPAAEAARRLGAKVHTVGIGATTAVDLSAAINAPLYVQKEEGSTIQVTVNQQGLEGQSVHVRVFAEPLGGVEGASRTRTPIGDKNVTLAGASRTIDFPYVPDKAGRFALVAEIDPVPGEIVQENNRATREIQILEDFLRLLYVEYEPTWEWRFIKEVFHRDKLVGLKGFRTFLHSSDPRVRKSNELFLPRMAASRADFFAHDVIFLGDMPASALSQRFCEMVKEFVTDFGGGLVVIAGPRFGVEQLSGTPLKDLLPVEVDEGARIDDRQPFNLQLTYDGLQQDFMRLGDSEQETRDAWANLGPLPWFQPVRKVHPQAVVLAEHPTKTCVNGKQKQPLIAVRQFKKGHVVYVGFNETWRMRRIYGERYYRQFWGQMIQRLALDHTLGSQKRFVVKTDRRNYEVDQQVTVTVEAYTTEFEPLDEKELPGGRLRGEILLPVEGDAKRESVQQVSLNAAKKGVYETRLTAMAPGEHRIRVTDPVTRNVVESTFQVAGTPIERQRAIRNVDLQRTIAETTEGATCGLGDLGSLVDRLQPTAKTETTIEVISLTSTWFTFLLIVLLLLGEWLARKWVNLQ